MRHPRSRILASACALVLGAAAPGVHSQETSKVAKSELEEVTVTGSLIKGTPETAAQPVEVMTEEEIRNLGRPSNLELVKLMSEVGQVAGEANRFNAYPIGAETINLRNIGSRFTTVIFNGRRFPEQFGPATGRFNNIAWIPNAAVSRVEILKQGGAATYGADAVGGVVNYITRRDANGFEVSGDYTRIADDDGDYNADITWGNKFSNGNLLLVAAYQHRSMLDANDRDWAQKDFLENPNWSAAGSPGSYIFMTTPGTASTGAITPLSGYTGDQQMSITGLVRDPSCTALGGFAGWSATPSPACYVRAANFDHLVEEQDQYQMYGEYNVEFANDLKLHVEGLYYQLDLPNIANSPSDAPGSWPLTTTRDASGLLTRQAAGVSPAYFVSGQNPAVADFLNNRFFNSNGTRAFTAAQIASVVNTGKVGLAQAIWRPFAYGGNPLHGETDLQQNNQKVYRMTTELTGSLPEFWGSRLSWNTAVTYSKVTYDVSAEDMLVDRLQAALNGFGGTSCNNIRAGLAGSQCEWFNPFGTAIQRNIYTGAGNPNYISGLANSNDLVKWLYVPIKLHRDYGLYVFDGLISGDTGWQMPGGPVAVAFGTQFRYTQERFQIDDYSNIQVNPCATVGVTDCVNRTGPLVFGRQVSVLGTTRNSDRFYPVAAGFAEVQVPILKSLNLQLAGRYEKFYSDVTDIDNSTFVPAAAIKWDPLPWVGARASWGRTFSQVNPPVNDGPVVATAGANNAFAGIQGYTTQNFDNVNVQSENGDYLDFGLLFDVGNFNASIDYWELNVDQYTRTMTVNQVLRALIGPGVAPTTATPLNCSSPLFNPQAGFDNAAYVVLPAGRTCGQAGAATLGDVGAGWGINYFGGTNESNSGKLETAGVDFSASYRFEMAGLSVTPSVDLTYNTKWKLGDFVVGGVTVAPGYEGLGQANRTTGRLNLAVPRYRGSVALLFKSGRHTLNLLVNYIPSVRNEDPTDFDVTNDQNANIGNGNGFTTTGTTAATVACTSSASGLTTNLGNVPGGASTGQFGGASIVTNATTGQPTPSVTTRGFCANQNVAVLSGREIASTTNVDLTYRLELPAELSMSLTVNNLFGDDPSFDRALVAYNSGFGSPLGRTYKLGLRKKF